MCVQLFWKLPCGHSNAIMYHCRDAEYSPSTGYVWTCINFTGCRGMPNALNTRRCQLRFCRYDGRPWTCCDCRLPNSAAPVVCSNLAPGSSLCGHRRCDDCLGADGGLGFKGCVFTWLTVFPG
jgi:hypothetical protein